MFWGGLIVGGAKKKSSWCKLGSGIGILSGNEKCKKAWVLGIGGGEGDKLFAGSLQKFDF